MAPITVTHERRLTKAYQLGSQVIVPHYRKPGIYVMPGGREFEEAYFRNFGARIVLVELWPRQVPVQTSTL